MPDFEENVKDQEEIVVEEQQEESLDTELVETIQEEPLKEPKKEKKQRKKILNIQNIRLNIPIAVRAAFLISITFLVVYIITIVSDSNTFMKAMSEQNALAAFDKEFEISEKNSEVHYDELYTIVDDIFYQNVEKTIIDEVTGEEKVVTERVERTVTSYRDIVEILVPHMNKGAFEDLYFTSNGKLFRYHDDHEISADRHQNYDDLKDFINLKERSCSKVFMAIFNDNENRANNAVALYVPVSGSQYIDGLISVHNVHNKDLVGISNYGSSAMLIESTTGQVLYSMFDDAYRETFDTKEHSELGSYISAISTDKFACKDILRELKNPGKFAYTLETFKGNYVLSSAPLSAFDGKLAVVMVHEDEGLVAEEMQYIRHVLNISIIALVSLACGVVYALIYYKKTQMALSLATILDPIVGCPNADAFRQEANKLIHRTPTKYALGVLELKQYSILTTKLDDSKLTILLGDVGRILQTFTEELETFGYLGEGRFAFLMYVTEEQDIKKRCRLIETVGQKNAILSKLKNTKNKFNIGICMTYESKRMSVQEIINNATAACEEARKDVNSAYFIYNRKGATSTRAKQTSIEAEMQNALDTGQFKLFLQPKLHIRNDKADSAEALVRWFDPKKGEYRFPGEFIGLFESNGFIVELDHYMYIETLKYVSNAIAKGEKIVPISVNVSLLTLQRSDFLDFYIEWKKNYHVGSGYITLEFTESFSMEDFERINEIVTKLHENGIKCSLDDFGSGYSTLGVLKNIPFDEIKFDRLFLQPGRNKNIDMTMLKSLIELAKSLNIKVVQEGVENREMYDRCDQLGVDVIQGYYYAKPISVEEYKIFINSNTSIKYKSLVK